MRFVEVLECGWQLRQHGQRIAEGHAVLAPAEY